MWYQYIHIIFLIQIYSDICLYHFFIKNHLYTYTLFFWILINLNIRLYRKFISKILYECIRTFEYFPIWIFVRIIFVSFFWYEYIRIFIRIAFLIRIYSDIRSYHLFDTNIFGYSFVSFFGYKYIRIFVRIENLYSPHPGPKEARRANRLEVGARRAPEILVVYISSINVYDKKLPSPDC